MSIRSFSLYLLILLSVSLVGCSLNKMSSQDSFGYCSDGIVKSFASDTLPPPQAKLALEVSRITQAMCMGSEEYKDVMENIFRKDKFIKGIVIQSLRPSDEFFYKIIYIDRKNDAQKGIIKVMEKWQDTQYIASNDELDSTLLLSRFLPYSQNVILSEDFRSFDSTYTIVSWFEGNDIKLSSVVLNPVMFTPNFGEGIAINVQVRKRVRALADTLNKTIRDVDDYFAVH